LSLLPLAVNRYKSVFFLYGTLNIAFLFIYITFNRQRFPIPDYTVIAFLSDNTVAILISSIVAYGVFSINRAALEKAKAEIAERTQAERIVQQQKRELEKVNNELSTALKQMEKTTGELKATNEQFETTQKNLLSSNLLLSESEEKFSKAFHQSPLLTGLMNFPHGQFTDISDSLCSLTGYTAEEMIGKTSGDLNLWVSENEYKKIKGVFINGGKLQDEEFVIRNRNDKHHTILMSSEVVSIGQSPHIILIGVDITERKRAEEEKGHLEDQLRQAQKMEAVGHLAGGIAHDFNNMLSVVIGNSELLMMEELLDADAQARINNIRDAARRSADLVRQLLAFARKQTVAPKILDVNDAISGMLKMLQRLIGEDIDLEWIPGNNLGPILIDPSQIDQILANLMVNARDAIDGVGKVTIETQYQEIDDAYCSGHPDFFPGIFIMLSVSDNGCGMTEKTIEQIFEPFFTTKGVSRGTGLGLATVYGIVKQNNGFIHVYSEPGKGSTFRIYFPRTDIKNTQEVALPPVHPPAKGSGTVLMVEDDLAILEIGHSILELLGYTVLTANSPENAIAMALAHSGDIDLLITDVVMPGMNGKELAERLAEIKPELRCLFMSGYTANVIAHHGVLDDGVMFLPKPFTVKDLADKVRDAWIKPISQ
jgi:PAS domain S-box-containing protein